MANDPRLRRRPVMKPRFTLGVIYLLVFFFLYCFLLVAPALWDVWNTVPVGPEQEEAAREAARQMARPRLWIAFAAAVATVAVGTWRGILPGTK